VTTAKKLNLTDDSPSVQGHSAVLQSVIQRMAANSVQCKTWCVTLVSAILILITDKNRPYLVGIGLYPIVIFGVLDAYYLGLEKQFRESYDAFVRKLHAGTLTPDDLFHVAPKGDSSKYQIQALKSFAVWGFYLSLMGLAFFVFFLLMPAAK
jgi:hypothetical protein